MTKLYKATDMKGKTNEKTGWGSKTKWGEGVRRKAKEGQFIRAHLHPILASLSQFEEETEVFADIQLWEADGEPISNDALGEEEQLTANDKTFGVVKCSELTTTAQIEVPSISSEILVAAGILCAREVFDEPQFVEWANGWFNGRDRTHASAEAIFKKASDVSSSAMNKALEAGKANDWDTHRKNLILNSAAWAVYQVAFAAMMLAIKDESANPFQAGNVYRSTIASSMGAKRAVASVSDTNRALSMMGREPIDYLKILNELGNESSTT